ncbi:alpha/beta hydrolase [Gemmata sp.]|uniref:alpha/beta hydrolase n=1 Tax=Gemmata sp. TaxID=1914242 RepID=UPI003F708424
MAARRTAGGQELLGAERAGDRLTLRTSAGEVPCRWHDAPSGDAAVLWVFGAGGGLNGPAGGLYPRLAALLAPGGVASLELAYRFPGDLGECVADVLLGVAHLASVGRTRVALVGHSFGGAVVIAAGAVSPVVVAVAALSSQTYGAGAVGRLSPRPFLLAHGTDDEVLPDACSRELFRRAGEPKELILYPGCRHGLDECRDALDRDLQRWLRHALAPPVAQFRPDQESR